MTHTRHKDSGAALILAIGFVVMIGAIAAGLASLVSSSMNNRGSLERLRNREYAAEGAIDDAVVQVRISAGAGSDLCQTSSGTSRTTSLNGYAIRVDWRSACGVTRGGDGIAVFQRNAIFAACVDAGAACTDLSVIIRAQVNFEQSSSGAVLRTSVQSWSVNQ